MKVIRPLGITAAMVISSTATPDPYPAYSTGGTYNTGDRVVEDESVWECADNGVTGIKPESGSTKWLRVGPVNRLAMIDNSVTTQTTGGAALEVAIQPGAVFSSLALVNLDGTRAVIEITDGVGGPLVYSRNIDLDGTDILDWYMYFFEPYDLLQDLYLTDLPPYETAVLKIRIEGTAGTAIGALVIGDITELGGTQYGIGVGVTDYSVKEEDQFGTSTLKEGAFAREMDPSIMVENSRLRLINTTLTRLRAKPTVWIASDDQDLSLLIVYGYPKRWRVEIPYPKHSLLRIEIRGMT